MCTRTHAWPHTHIHTRTWRGSLGCGSQLLSPALGKQLQGAWREPDRRRQGSGPRARTHRLGRLRLSPQPGDAAHARTPGCDSPRARGRGRAGHSPAGRPLPRGPGARAPPLPHRPVRAGLPLERRSGRSRRSAPTWRPRALGLGLRLRLRAAPSSAAIFPRLPRPVPPRLARPTHTRARATCFPPGLSRAHVGPYTLAPRPPAHTLCSRRPWPGPMRARVCTCHAAEPAPPAKTDPCRVPAPRRWSHWLWVTLATSTDPLSASPPGAWM